jgi:hypothetical protein
VQENSPSRPLSRQKEINSASVLPRAAHYRSALTQLIFAPADLSALWLGGAPYQSSLPGRLLLVTTGTGTSRTGSPCTSAGTITAFITPVSAPSTTDTHPAINACSFRALGALGKSSVRVLGWKLGNEEPWIIVLQLGRVGCSQSH